MVTLLFLLRLPCETDPPYGPTSTPWRQSLIALDTLGFSYVARLALPWAHIPLAFPSQMLGVTGLQHGAQLLCTLFVTIFCFVSCACCLFSLLNPARLRFSSEIWKLFRHNSLPYFLHVPPPRSLWLQLFWAPWAFPELTHTLLTSLPSARAAHCRWGEFLCSFTTLFSIASTSMLLWGFLFLILFVCFLRQGRSLDPGWPSIFYGTQANSLESTTPLLDGQHARVTLSASLSVFEIGW